MTKADTLIAHTLDVRCHSATEDGTGRGSPLVSMCLTGKAGTRHDATVETLIAFEPGSIARDAGPAGESPLCPTLRSDMGDNQPAVRHGMSVRRLTPRECERLQGMPDDWTLVPYRGKPSSDGPRYKAIGNSIAVPVLRWIGERIDAKAEA